MPYLGSAPKSGFISNAKERYTGITTAYVDLSQSIASLADVIVWVNFIKQDSTNLTLTSSTRITLGGTLTASDIVEVAYLGKAVATQTPGTGTVTNDMLAGSIDLTSKVTGALPQANIADQAINEAKLQISNSPTNGYFLSAQSGNTGGLTWAEAGGGSWTLLSTTNVSDGTSTVNMTLSGSYTIYAVSFNNLIPNNDNNTLRHAFSDDNFNSVNQQIYGGFGIHGVTKSAFFTNDNFQQALGYVRIADNVGGNNTYEGVRGIIYYANMRTAAPKGMYWGNVMGYNHDEKASNHTLAGWMDSTNICTGIAYNYDSGTFKSGQIKLYGIE